MKVIPKTNNSSITFRTKDVNAIVKGVFKWWKAADDNTLTDQVLGTVAYLKETQSYLQRQTGVYARLYGNKTLFNYAGTSSAKMDVQSGLPSDRPTFNIIQSSVDTLVARLSQSRPAPTFLTDGGDYKQRRIAKQLNNFILGELYQTKAYDKATIALRDACVAGTGILKVYEGPNNKVVIDRVLMTELFVDSNDGMYGEPRQMFQMKLIDRDVLMDMSPKFKKVAADAATAYPDSSSDSTRTVSDQVMVVEAWHLPSSAGAKDGRHVIACSSGTLLDEKWEKDKFPFVFIHFSPRLMGFWAQGVSEQLMGTQLEINSLLYTISKAIKLVGVPRVFVENASKVSKASFSDSIGTLIYYTGTKPSYEVAPAVPAEMYAQLQRLIDYGYQQVGVSAMQASSQKPAGLNSGEAIRSYDDISTDRYAVISKRYDTVFIDLTYQITELARDIAIRDGKYQTIYPNKDGTKEIDLPAVKMISDPFIVQVFNQSSLPKDPSGRMQKITEMIQSGMITIKEGRRLLDYPDLDQVERLANASEERIFQILDKIVEDAEYTPPDTFMDLQLAEQLSIQYYNLYIPANLEEDKAEMLRQFFSQVQTMKQAAMPPAAPPGAAPGGEAPTPAANPQPLPTSPLVPNGNPAGAQ